MKSASGTWNDTFMENPPNPTGRRVSVQTVLTGCILIICAVEMFVNFQILGLAHGNATMIRDGKTLAIAAAARNEKLLLDFMSRTVDRWEKLQRDNPDVLVPYVIEPLVQPHLKDEDMNRTTRP